MRGIKSKLSIAAASLFAAVLVVVALMRIPATRYAILRTFLPLTTSLTVAPLRGDAYWISGGLSNTGFVVGDTGVVVIDTQMFVSTARRQIAEIGRVTPRPIDVVILTHSDPDHVNGLPAYPRGIEIVAQDNAASEMALAVKDPGSNGFPAEAGMAAYLPTHTVRAVEDTVIDGVPMRLIHTASAHTDGDLAIYLPLQKIVYAGDLLTPAIGPYPGIHLNKHGSSLGWIESMKAILSLDADLYVPGHGDMLTKAELMRRLQACEDRRARIKALFEQGRTLAEAKTALEDVPLKGVASQFPTFVETTYQELASERRTRSPAR